MSSPIKTYHCAFCSQLLLATTRSLQRLPTRRSPALDAALILPLSDKQREEDTNEAEKAKTTPLSILLATAIRDRNPLIIRRQDGFERRRLVRCGRCRVVVAYFLLDALSSGAQQQGLEQETEEDGEQQVQQEKDTTVAPNVVYLLPGSLVDTDRLDDPAFDEERVKGDWTVWEELGKGQKQQVNG